MTLVIAIFSPPVRPTSIPTKAEADTYEMEVSGFR